jgi:Spy/CpxP family protein refolding chaperone
MMGHGMMGPGMMGYGPMGPGMMMGAPGAMMGLERLDLSAEQRSRIAQIQDEAHEQHQVLMELMHAPDGPMTGMMGGDASDDAAARQAYETMSTLHKAMFEAHLETRRKILDLLTPVQREQLTRSWRRGPGS